MTEATNPKPKYDPNDHGVWWTAISIVLIVIFGSLGYAWQNYLVVAICVGAVGGLVHEIVQSGGKYILPTTDNGNFMLGGLIGLIDGAIAGLLLMQGQNGPVANPQVFMIAVFFAGLALKGVNDAVNPLNSSQTKGTTP